MRWPLLITGGLFVVLALRLLMVEGTERAVERGTVPRSAWLLLLPILVVFAVAPPPLGAFLAEQRADQSITLREPDVVQVPAPDRPLVLALSEFQWGARQPDDPMSLAGRKLSLTGFVSRDENGWYVTRLEMFCCAADAMVMTHPHVQGHRTPPRNQVWHTR